MSTPEATMDNVFSFSELIPVWFDDGTLIIKVEDVQFKVYRGLLSAKSSVFRDMFMLNPHAEKEVVKLNDTAADVSYFLKALHDSDFFIQPKPTLAAPFPIVAAILRLSDKYDVPSLRQRAVQHLTIVYPTSLAAYDLNPQFESAHISDHLGAIKLSRTFDIPWIRPIAVYRYVSRPLEEVLVTLRDSGLSREDFDICVRAIRAFKLLEFLCNASPTRSNRKCRSATPCTSTQSQKWNDIFLGGDADPLEAASGCTKGLCDDCRFINMHYSRAAVWDTIPSSLDNQTWDKLEELKKAAALD